MAMLLACLAILGTRLACATEFDAETGLMHMGAREYDPETSRFLQEDPILQDGPISDPKLFQRMNIVDSMHGSSSLYQYAFNSPTNYSDPSGTFPIGWLLPWIIPNPANAPGLSDPTYYPVISDADLEAMNALGAMEVGGEACSVANDNRYLRIGMGRTGYGRRFRTAGDWIEWLTGNRHWDPWNKP